MSDLVELVVTSVAEMIGVASGDDDGYWRLWIIVATAVCLVGGMLIYLWLT